MLEYQEENYNGEIDGISNFNSGGIFDFPYQLTHIDGIEIDQEKQINFT